MPGDDQIAVTRAGAGGQAANVAAWAAALGAEARFVGQRGDDAAASSSPARCAATASRSSGPAAGRTGVVVSIASAGDRTMASDRGAAPDLAPQRPRARVVRLRRAPSLRLLAAARADRGRGRCAPLRSRAQHGAQVSLDLSTWTLVDDAFRERVRAIAPDLVFATERERDAVGELDARWVLKRGARGARRRTASTTRRVATDVVDTTGAGDALAAGYLVGGVELGLEAAARCCAKLGAMP